jgi:hemerythrin
MAADMAFTISIGLDRIGIGVFDREHDVLFGVLQALQAEIEGSRRDDQIGELLGNLARGIDAHFQSEEAMMRTSAYPGLALHAMKHERLLEQLKVLRMRYARDHSIMNRHTLNFLRDWFGTHIQTDDTNFGLWQNEHGKI